MTFLKSIWQDLVEKRLWPVAVLLVLALVAVPFLLGRGGDDTTASAPAVATPAVDPGTAAQEAEVSVDDDTPAPSDRPGALRDPFKPQRSAARTTTSAGTPAQASTTPPAAGAASPGSGTASAPSPSTSSSSSSGSTSSATSTTSTTSTTTSTTTRPVVPAPTITLRDYEVALRFQPADAPRTRRARQDVARLTALPSAKAPAALLLGVMAGGGKAAFMLPKGVSATGEGTCRPSKSSCATVELAVGETEYLDVAGAEGTTAAQYVLELVRIVPKRLATVAEARGAHARRSTEGAKLLRDAVRGGAGATSAYAYDYDTGVVTRTKAKASAKKATARAARTVTTTVTVPAPAPAPGATTAAPAATTPTWP